MINLLKRLMLTHGVSGRENLIREAIRKEVEPYADEVTIDAIGNLIAHKKGSGKRVMFGAHMDEIGYFATHIRSNGLISVAPIGGINLISGAFTGVVSEGGVVGVLGTVAKGAPDADEVFIDIGATDKRQAEKRVKVGDSFVHTPSITHLMGTRYVGRPFDDRVGCAILIEVLKNVKSTENDLYFVFTVQEEVGCRGARPVTYSVEPDIAIALDVTRTDDKGGDTLNVSIGKGPTIKIKDASVICSHELVLKMRELAREGKIKYQDEMLSRGGTDTSSMQIAKRGCRAGAISIPCGYIHTGIEMIDMKDVRGAVRLATLIAERI